MRPLKAVLLLTLALALGPAASASEKPYLVHGGLGYCKVLNDDAPDGSVGLQGGLMYRLEQSPQIGIGAEVGYLMLGSFTYTVYDLYGNYGNFEATWTAIPVTGNLYYFLTPNESTPFFLAGVGMYPIKVKVKAEESYGGLYGAAEASETNTDLGLDFGAGMLFGTGRSQIRFGVDGRFHLIMTENESTNLLTIMGKVFF